jgi:hypothetical protein
MSAHAERGKPDPFHLWILHEPRGGSLFTIRYEVYRGMGALRLGGLGAVTPSLKRGRLRGLSADHLRQGRFLLFPDGSGQKMQEIPIWSAAEPPGRLPADEWTLMLPSSQGMTPDGWVEQEPPPEEECVTDLTPGRGLGLALETLKARRSARSSASAEVALSSAPLGLVRHLQNIIEQQRSELDALRAEVARLRRSGERNG